MSDAVLISAQTYFHARQLYVEQSVRQQSEQVSVNKRLHAALVQLGTCSDPFESSGFQCVVVPPTEVYVAAAAIGVPTLISK